MTPLHCFAALRLFAVSGCGADAEADVTLVAGERAYVVVGRFTWPCTKLVDLRRGNVAGARMLRKAAVVGRWRALAWPPLLG